MDYTKTTWTAHETRVTADAMNNIEDAVDSLMGAIPDIPTSDGTYVLKVVVSSGVATFSWVAEE